LLSRFVATLDNALNRVLALRGVSFKWDQDAFPRLNLPAGRQIGFLAQEVEQVLPELVSTDQDGYKSVAYANVVPVLVVAIKQQQKQLDAVKAENAQMKALLASLAARLAQLEAKAAMK
jgi:hypothetical protein